MPSAFGKGLGSPWQSPGRGYSPVTIRERVLPVSSAPIKEVKPKGPGNPNIKSPIEVTQFQLTGSTGNQDISINGFGRPSGAILITSDFADNTGTQSAEMLFAFGATDGTRSWSVNTVSEGDVATSNVTKEGSTTDIIHLANPSGVEYVNAIFVKWIKDGIRINVTLNDDASTRYVTLILFSRNIDVYANELLANVVGTIDVTGPGFEPDAIIFATTYPTANIGFDEISGTSCQINMAFAANDSSVLQGGTFCAEDDNVGTSTPRGLTYDDVFQRDGGLMRTSVTSFDSVGFNVEVSGADLLRPVGYIAFKLPPGFSAWGGVLNSPIVAGPSTLGTAPFKPTFGLIFPNMVTVINSLQSDGRGSGLGISIFTDNYEASMAWSIEDNQTTMDCATSTNNIAIDLDDHTGAQAFTGTFTKFIFGGAEINFTAVNSTIRLWPTLFIGK